MVVRAAKSEEELHHVLWVAVLLSFHVDLDPQFDRFFPVRCQKPVARSSQLVDALDYFEKLAGGTGTFIQFRGPLGFEVRLHLLRVLGGSRWSVTGRH